MTYFIYRILLSIWPGLPQLWLRGSLLGLAWAVGFGIALQTALWTCVVWPEIIPSSGHAIVWGGVLTIWVVGQFAAGSWPSAEVDDSDHDAEMYEAQTYYLRGDWERAARCLEPLLQGASEDSDARLLLAGIHRRAGRPALALQELELVMSGPGAAKWQWEVAREREGLAAAAVSESEHHADPNAPHTEAAPAVLRSDSSRPGENPTQTAEAA